MLWKNLIIVCGALSAAWFLASSSADEKEHRRILMALLTATLGATMVVFTAIPILVTYALIGGCILLLGFYGIPLVAVYLCVTAVVPILEYRLPGALGLNTLAVLSTPAVAGLAMMLLRLLKPGAFRSMSISGLDFAALFFIVVRVVLSNREESVVLMLRVLCEDLLILGGAFLVGSRANSSSPVVTLRAFVFIGVALALIAVFEALRWWPQYVGVSTLRGISDVRGMIARAGMMRATGPFADPLAFSIFLASAAIAGIGLMATVRKPAIAGFCVLLTTAGLACTFSRTGLVALGAALFLFAILRRTASSFAMLVSALVLCVLYLSRISDTGTAVTAQYRWQVLSGSLRLIQANPLIGVSKDHAKQLLQDLVQGQGIIDVVNSYLGLAISGGLILVASFLLVPLIAILSYLKGRSRLSHNQQLFGDVVVSQLVGTLCALMFTSLTDKNLVYVLFFSGLLNATGRAWFRKREDPGGLAMRKQQNAKVALRQRLIV